MAISFSGSKKYKKHGGISDNMSIKTPLPSPVHVYPLTQGILALNALVNEGDRVLCGQKIADIEEFNTIPVISSASGKVISVSDDVIIVENDAEYECITPNPPQTTVSELTSREILWLLREGAVTETRTGVPIHVLLSEKNVSECIIVCCFDSDPYISSPQAASCGNAEKILAALETVMRVSGINKAYAAVENDTKKTFRDFKFHLRFNASVTPYLLKARYPQSDSDKLIKTVTGSDECRAMILSSETLLNMYNVLTNGESVTRKIVTVSGDDILGGANYSAPIGSSISTLLESAGYTNAKVVINGGIMNGERITDLDMPVSSSCGAILAFADEKNIPSYRKKPL